MTISELSAQATTSEIVPGDQQQANGRVRSIQQRFTDIVECADERLAGTNRLTLDLEFEPSTGAGNLQGRFVLESRVATGTWEGELVGTLTGGKVTAAGIARGRGAFDGSVLRLDFQQLDAHPLGRPPCAEPKAFFAIRGLLLG